MQNVFGAETKRPLPGPSAISVTIRLLPSPLLQRESGWGSKCQLSVKILSICPQKSYTIHSTSPRFFRKVVRIEPLPVRATILVSCVPRGERSGLLAVEGGRREK